MVPFHAEARVDSREFLLRRNVEGMKNWKFEEGLENSLEAFSYDSKGNCSLVVKSDSTSIVSLKQRTKCCPGNRKKEILAAKKREFSINFQLIFKI